MSQQHRNNPDSEENERMTRDNEKAVLYAQMGTLANCPKCGRLVPPWEAIVFDECEGCQGDYPE